MPEPQPVPIKQNAGDARQAGVFWFFFFKISEML